MLARAREDESIGHEAEHIFLLATNTNNGGEDSAFCPDNGAVASCGNSDEFRAWTGIEGAGWSDRQVSWFYRDPDDECKWAFHCKYSLNTVNSIVVNATMHQLLAKSADCRSSGGASAAAVAACVLCAIAAAAAGFVYYKRREKANAAALGGGKPPPPPKNAALTLSQPPVLPPRPGSRYV